MELATGTDHLKKTSKPVYTIEILTPVAERSVTALQTLVQPLRLQTVLKGSKGGTWPVGGQTLSVSAPDNHTLLAWEETGRGLRWQPKVVSAGVTNAQGIACLQVHPGWKGPTLNLTLKSTPGPGCPAGVRAATVTCQLKVSPPELDKDADGMPDDWESRPATQGQPAHGLAAASALDAEAGPQHFGYHPSTPAERLMPASISVQSLSEILPARFSSQYFQMSLPEPSTRPRQLPRSIGPAGTKIAGRLALIAPISSAGVVLSHPPIRTAPSTGKDRSVSSTSIASRFR
jgi:hypothetical protein